MSAGFRRAAPPDVPAIPDLMAGLYGEDGVVVFRREAAETALRDLIATPDLGAVWVAEVGGEAVGYLAVTWGFSLEYHGRDAFIDELYVAPASSSRTAAS